MSVCVHVRESVCMKVSERERETLSVCVCVLLILNGSLAHES